MPVDNKQNTIVHGRARREAARRRISECKVNLLSRNSSRSNGSWWITPKRTTWHMDLRQLTVYEEFGWINMHAVTFSFVYQSSSRGLKKFGENIPTSPISPEVIHVHRLNFKPNFKFSRLKFFWLEGPPSQLGCALGSLGQSLAHVKISGRSPPPKGENSLPKNAHYGGSILTSINFSFVDQTSQTF